jgi:hypothetical protein
MSNYSKIIRSDSGFVQILPKQEIILAFKYYSVVFTKNQEDYILKDIKDKVKEQQPSIPLPSPTPSPTPTPTLTPTPTPTSVTTPTPTPTSTPSLPPSLITENNEQIVDENNNSFIV